MSHHIFHGNFGFKSPQNFPLWIILSLIIVLDLFNEYIERPMRGSTQRGHSFKPTHHLPSHIEWSYRTLAPWQKGALLCLDPSDERSRGVKTIGLKVLEGVPPPIKWHIWTRDMVGVALISINFFSKVGLCFSDSTSNCQIMYLAWIFFNFFTTRSFSSCSFMGVEGFVGGYNPNESLFPH